MVDKVTVITPTGDRPECLELLRQWVAHQTRQPDQWLIVDDGKNPVQAVPEAHVVHRLRQADDLGCTLGKNLEMAMRFVKHNKIIIMEDDDWYGPDYLKTMASLLDDHELVGIWGTNYYNPKLPGYMKMGRNDHASMSQTGFRKSFIPKLLRAIPGDCSVDFRIWFSFENGKYIEGKPTGHLIPGEGKYLHCSMKEMPGRPGAGCGHNKQGYIRDNELIQFKKWCLDVEAYRPYLKEERLVVYTAIAGGGRDKLIDPDPVDGVDYVCFTDQPFTSKIWDIRPFKWVHPTESVRTAKHPKALPHLYFPHHDLSVWVDGNIKAKADIKTITYEYLKQHDFAVHHHAQRNCLYEEAEVVMCHRQDHIHLVEKTIERYRRIGVPANNGLSENGILFRRHNEEEVKDTMNLWWKEISEGTNSDQIPMAYALWKLGLAVRWISGNLRSHPAIKFYPHETLYWGKPVIKSRIGQSVVL